MLEYLSFLPYRSFGHEERIFFPDYIIYINMMLLAFLARKNWNFIATCVSVHYSFLFPKKWSSTNDSYKSFRKVELSNLPYTEG